MRPLDGILNSSLVYPPVMDPMFCSSPFLALSFSMTTPVNSSGTST